VIVRAAALSVELGTPDHAGIRSIGLQGVARDRRYLRADLLPQGREPLPAVVSVTALRDAQGAIIGYLLIGTDNSVRKQVEWNCITPWLSRKKANLAKTEFLSNMSHELRSPLKRDPWFRTVDGVRRFAGKRPPRRKARGRFSRQGGIC